MSLDKTVVKSYLVLLVLEKPKRWEQSSVIQKVCSQKTPYNSNEQLKWDLPPFAEDIRQIETAVVKYAFNYSTVITFSRRLSP